MSLLPRAMNGPTAISEQFGQGFINEEERYRLTVENWTTIEARFRNSSQANEHRGNTYGNRHDFRSTR